MIKLIDMVDIAACEKVIKESFNTVANEFGFTAENAPGFVAFAITEEKLAIQLQEERRHMYAFYDGNNVVGYYSLLIEDKECELNNLCVLPKYRHNGIGEELLKHAFKIAEEFNCMTIKISIVEENAKIRKWYEKYGFNHVRTQKYDFFPFTCGYMEKEI